MMKKLLCWHIHGSSGNSIGVKPCFIHIAVAASLASQFLCARSILRLDYAGAYKTKGGALLRTKLADEWTYLE